MKKLILLFLSIMFMHCAFADEDNDNISNGSTATPSQTTAHSKLPANYQYFKHCLLEHNTRKQGIPASNYQGGDDFIPLYIAGGILAVTAGFVLINGKDEYTGKLGEANTGIIIGGGVSTVVLTSKFFIDKLRK